MADLCDSSLTASPALPDEAWLLGLASLPRMGPISLRRLLDRWPPDRAWQAIVDASTPQSPVYAVADRSDRVEAWHDAARAIDVAARWRAHVEARVGVVTPASPAYPVALRDDLEPPAVLLSLGDLAAVHPLAVAVVGTRRCTRYGIDIAYELGATLAEAGVTVVSGLAAGIDAAAHSGALEAGGVPPVAVVAGALNRPYPHQNASLWRAVAQRGAILSEAPFGTPAKRWRFPARNRIIAGLGLITVVIESHAKGGSLYTATEAARRDRPVFAVPGPIRSPASEGTNRLLADGHHVLCEPSDILVAAGLAGAAAQRWQPPRVEPRQQQVLDSLGWQPRTLAELASGLPEMVPSDLVDLLGRVIEAGLVVRRGAYFERTALVVAPGGP